MYAKQEYARIYVCSTLPQRHDQAQYLAKTGNLARKPRLQEWMFVLAFHYLVSTNSMRWWKGSKTKKKRKEKKKNVLFSGITLLW